MFIFITNGTFRPNASCGLDSPGLEALQGP